jgi:hypothetical protein
MTYWWVNQSKTYQAERGAGIMWAPQQTRSWPSARPLDRHDPAAAG